ncbi:DUF2793 domain-containing protein [Donghicola sp. XS_ASV15]|uniref:DUF2793 domain-containing protein n=1 Tax=Donghicola sp. XS_ASV15 TaxID=3241295 RepID=UPI0035112860
MTSASPRLDLPMIQPSQAQKHVTHNEAILRLDGAIQLVLQGLSVVEPPESPIVGHAYFTSDASTGAWSEYPRMVATWTESGWIYLQPFAGWMAWDAVENRAVVYLNDAWSSLPVDLQNLPSVGIGATADATNRLIVASEAALFTHAGASQQIKINKATAADTGSLVLQTNWAGRAEIGLCGDNALHLKVSDGSTWFDALVFDPTNGVASGTAVQSSPTDTTQGKLMRADYGYGPGNILGPVSFDGTTPTGGIIERIESASGTVIRFADGTQICSETVTLAGATTSLGNIYASDAAIWTYPAAFSDLPKLSFEAHGANGVWASATDVTPSVTEAPLMALSALSTTASIQVNCIAIGRW